MERKKLQNLIFLAADFLLHFFSQLYNNQNKSYIIKYNAGGRRLKYLLYFFATLNTKIDVMLLPTGYNSDHLKNFVIMINAQFYWILNIHGRF